MRGVYILWSEHVTVTSVHLCHHHTCVWFIILGRKRSRGQASSDTIICRLLYGQTSGQADGRTGGQSDSRTVGQSDSRTVGQTDSRTVGQSDSRTVGQSDSRTVGQLVRMYMYSSRLLHLSLLVGLLSLLYSNWLNSYFLCLNAWRFKLRQLRNLLS